MTGSIVVDVIIIAVILFLGFLSWSWVRVNYKLDITYDDKDNETAVLSDGLSELENGTLNMLLRAFEEDGVNIANTDNIEQYEETEENIK